MSAAITPQTINLEDFSVWLDRNESFQTPYSEKTKRVYLSVISGVMGFLFKEDIRSFSEFNKAWGRRFIGRNPETNEPYSQSYQTLRASALNVFWYWLVEIGATNDNPIALLIEEKKQSTNKPSGGKRPKRLPVVLNWDEQRRLLAEVEQSDCRTSVRDFALIALVLASGLRCEEVCTLLLPNIELGYRRLRVIGKGNKERIVDFSHDSQAVGALELWLLEREQILATLGKKTDAAFISINGKPMTGSLVYQQVAKYLKRAGLSERARHKGSHLLRHTATSIMFARNVPVLQIQENLGHEQLVTTQIYAHLLPQELPVQSSVV
jgi:site-specific recombinase XerD